MSIESQAMNSIDNDILTTPGYFMIEKRCGSLASMLIAGAAE